MIAAMLSRVKSHVFFLDLTAFSKAKRKAQITLEDEEFEALPDFVKKAFRGNKGEHGYWDPEILRWWAPRVKRYLHLPKKSTARALLADRLIRDFFKRFRDTHPDYLKFFNPSSVNKYVARIRNFVQGKAFQLSKVLATSVDPSHAPAITTQHLDTVINRMFLPPSNRIRAHDLWAKDENNRKQLDEQFEAMWKKKVAAVGVKAAKDQRVKDQQAFRHSEFLKLDSEEQQPWYDKAKNLTERKFDESEWTIEGLPVLYMIINWFSDRSGFPVLLLTGGPSLQDPGMAEVYT